MVRKTATTYLAIALSIGGYAYAQQPWSGVVPSNRATDWSFAGIPGGIPSGSWAQCGATIAAYGSSGAPGSPATINNAIARTGSGYTGCSTPYVIALGSGDFYLNGSINLASNVVIRGAGANTTRLHFTNGGSYACTGGTAVTCMSGTVTYTGSCSVSQWPCPNGQFNPGYAHQANWTAGYAQGTSTITLDSVAGIVPNLTPIVLDQCDTGYAGIFGSESCGAGSGGIITSATVLAGGAGYAVNDTGTINAGINWGRGYGSGTATYQVTSVSGGVVTGFTITNGGYGYTYTSSTAGTPYNPTTKTSGGGSGFQVKITGVTGYDNNSIFMCAVTMMCTYLSDSGSARVARSQEEVVIATAISGNGPYTVTLNRPLMHPNWAPSQGPQAWWGGTPITNTGIENVGLDMSAISSGAAGVSVQDAYKVWIKGISSNVSNVFHVYAFVVSNLLVRDSYFYQTLNHGILSYGLGSTGQLGNSMWENNIVQGVVDPVVMNGSCTGCVVDYNFAVNNADNATSAMFAMAPMHSAGTDYILTEGNVGSGAYPDNSHGPHFLNTYYRNYFNGYEANEGVLPTQATIPIIIGAFSRYTNIVANVLGTPGYHKVYQCIPSSSTQHYCSTDGGSFPGYVHIFDLGFSDGSQIDFSNNPAEPNDLLTAPSTLRWGNWDNVTNAARWCGNSSNAGWSTTCGSTSEVPTTDPNFPVPIPTVGDTSKGQGALPASFLYSAAPSWWPSGKAWPAIGPDVTTGNIGQCTGGTYSFSKATNSSQCTGGTFLSPASTAGSHAVSIPAMDCYLTMMGGVPDGTGPMLSFNANTCYGQGGSIGAPNPPTAVTVSIH